MMKAAKRMVGKALPRLKDYIRIRAGFKGNHGVAPNILFPKTFGEKTQHRKLFDRDPRLPQRADKILVKDFVRAKLGDGWTTPTLWYGTELPSLSERTWPIPFVVKGSHGSGMNVFVRDKPHWASIEPLCQKWTSELYGDWGCEWLYSKIQPRLLVEPFVGELTQLPVDYKFWTFHGRVEIINVHTDRETGHKSTMLDRNWNLLPFTSNIDYPIDFRDIPRPTSLETMIDAAEILSEGVSFVRVDLYEINSLPRFGELTYYPDSGWSRFNPPEFDRKVGGLW
jgi:TupA-like ATPgrasp